MYWNTWRGTTVPCWRLRQDLSLSYTEAHWFLCTYYSTVLYKSTGSDFLVVVQMRNGALFFYFIFISYFRPWSIACCENLNFHLNSLIYRLLNVLVCVFILVFISSGCTFEGACRFVQNCTRMSTYCMCRMMSGRYVFSILACACVWLNLTWACFLSLYGDPLGSKPSPPSSPLSVLSLFISLFLYTQTFLKMAPSVLLNLHKC